MHAATLCVQDQRGKNTSSTHPGSTSMLQRENRDSAVIPSIVEQTRPAATLVRRKAFHLAKLPDVAGMALDVAGVGRQPLVAIQGSQHPVGREVIAQVRLRRTRVLKSALASFEEG